MGVGLNLNSQLKDFPTDLQGTITTLKHITKKEWDVNPFITLLLNTLDQVIYDFKSKGTAWFLKEVTKNLAYLNMPVTITENLDQICAGTLLGLNADGFLNILKTNSRTKTIMTGDVSLRPVINKV